MSNGKGRLRIKGTRCHSDCVFCLGGGAMGLLFLPVHSNQILQLFLGTESNVNIPKKHTAESARDRVCEGKRMYKHQNIKTTKKIHTRDLVDSASSHMLVSRTKPCMPQNNCICRSLRMAHYIRRNLPQKCCGFRKIGYLGETPS